MKPRAWRKRPGRQRLIAPSSFWSQPARQCMWSLRNVRRTNFDVGRDGTVYSAALEGMNPALPLDNLTWSQSPVTPITFACVPWRTCPITALALSGSSYTEELCVRRNRFLVALIFDGVAGGATGVAVVAGRATLAAGVEGSAA
jgi:hypothetical protein